MVRHIRTAGLSLVSVICLLTSLAGTSSACPSCPTSLTVRDQVFDQDFDRNLMVSLAPFLLVGWIARWFEKEET